MFRIRTLFWVAAVFLLLPTSSPHYTAASGYQPARNETGAVNAAGAINIEAFCATRPNICLARDEAWSLVARKAQVGYVLAKELFWGLETRDLPTPRERTAGTTISDILKDSDRTPRWRNPNDRG